jgi:hypothetical protein
MKRSTVPKIIYFIWVFMVMIIYTKLFIVPKILMLLNR